MKTELYDYDIFPKVVQAGVPTAITIHPLGLHAAFPSAVRLTVSPLQERVYPQDSTPPRHLSLQFDPGR